MSLVQILRPHFCIITLPSVPTFPERRLLMAYLELGARKLNGALSTFGLIRQFANIMPSWVILS
jgi:hypothetical protein